jgi:hypothetical protein
MNLEIIENEIIQSDEVREWKESVKKTVELFYVRQKGFNWESPVCQFCGEMKRLLLCVEKGWVYYHCHACGWEIHKSVKLAVSDKARDNERPSVSKQDLNTYVTVQCQRCGCDIAVNMRQAYRGRKYCKSCIPHATRERQMGKKKGIRADVA